MKCLHLPYAVLFSLSLSPLYLFSPVTHLFLNLSHLLLPLLRLLYPSGLQHWQKKKKSSRLHVDLSRAGDDLHEWECQQPGRRGTGTRWRTITSGHFLLLLLSSALSMSAVNQETRSKVGRQTWSMRTHQVFLCVHYAPRLAHWTKTWKSSDHL